MAKHEPNDPYNCLCKECVYASLVRMGGPWRAQKTTKAEFMKGLERSTGEATDGRG